MEILRNIRIVIMTVILMQLFLVSCIDRKLILYCPELPQMITRWGHGLVEGKETEQVLDEIAYEDTTIYRHITGDWYIELEHDR